MRKAEFVIDFIKVNPPNSLLEGMVHKYSVFSYEEEFLMYCDLDVFVYRNLSLLNLGKTDSLYLHAEGKISETEYNEAFNKEEKEVLQENAPGFSAGKFIIRGQNIRDILFKKINSLIGAFKTTYFTVEQPHFNKAIYALINEIPINPFFITTPLISNNFKEFSESDTILIDFQGLPGDGAFHLDKILDFMAYTNVT
jgi:hypothetical protein